jgi:hypothetical protein
MRACEVRWRGERRGREGGRKSTRDGGKQCRDTLKVEAQELREEKSILVGKMR